MVSTSTTSTAATLVARMVLASYNVALKRPVPA
jgi:hypothetical protein